MNRRRAGELFRQMLTARAIDERERVLVSQNLAHFHVSGAGHEASAALGAHLHGHDWLHLHYRDKALLLVRGLPVAEFFRSVLGRGGSHSAGRQMSAHFSAPHLNITSLVGPVGNNALQAVGVAAAIKDQTGCPIVVCSVGDGTTQEGEFLEAVAEAVRLELPVMFLIEDNRWSISTPTRGKTLFDLPSGPATEFYGLPIRRLDGTDVVAADAQLGPLVAAIRGSRRPELVVLEVERLADHTNADDQMRYRGPEEVRHGRAHADPLVKLREFLLRTGVTAAELDDCERSVRQAVHAAAELALSEAEPLPVFTAKGPLPAEVASRPEYRGDPSSPRFTMREAITGVLHARLSANPRVFLYGQDIEDPKGDVFGVTSGLSTAFPGRVLNAPLSESTIVGTSIGRALAGQRPVAFIQFADFLPLAFNQISSELGSMYWRTNGGWQCPVIVMVACGGYKPGLGPFHAQTMEGFAAHVPGIDVVMPSSAADAAGLLNAAFDSLCPTIMFYPKSCLNLAERATSCDVADQFVPPGHSRCLRSGHDLTLVSWGRTVMQCEEAARFLVEVGFTLDLLDLRTLSPWDKASVIASAEKTGRLVVVHEDNHTGGFGAEVLATAGERVKRHLQMGRVTRSDSYIPYNYSNQLDVLPSLKTILEACADLLGCDVTWERPPSDPPGQATIRAVGSGPADEVVEIVGVRVLVGDEVEPGQTVAEIEASKSVVTVCATAAGKVVEVAAAAGQCVPVGAILIRLATDHAEPSARVSTHHANVGTPSVIRRNGRAAATRLPTLTAMASGVSYCSRPACVLGGRIVSSESLAANIAGWTAEEVIKRTGVASRHWQTEDENVVSMAIRASHKLLASLDVTVPPITAVICSTTTPRESSPSVACQVATSLRDHEKLSPHHFAFDFNAACSGFLYGLRLASDMLRGNPGGSILLVTSEVASHMLDIRDASTVFLFGDAASASLVTAQGQNQCLKLDVPFCLASADPEISIHLPCLGTSRYLRMDGIAVARTAYKAMANAVRRASEQAGIALSEIPALIPHPGSKRILQNVADALDFDSANVLTTLADTGNTSSSSIPLALDRHWKQLPQNRPIALTAFGAGFTAAATIAQRTGGI